MSRTMYREQVTDSPVHPTNGDYYAIGISPPTHSDTAYCGVEVEGRSWGGSARTFDTRTKAIDYIHQRLETIEEKALDEKRQGGINHYPEPPTPSNTEYVVHPDYEGEIGPREIWGDATLGSFGVSPQSQFEDQSWYQTRDAYNTWGLPVREEDVVLRVFTEKYGRDTLYWFTASGDSLMMAEYRDGGLITKARGSSWTFLTRLAGGIGLTFSTPKDRLHLSVEQTPFHAGTSEDDVLTWFEHHPPELPPSNCSE